LYFIFPLSFCNFKLNVFTSLLKTLFSSKDATRSRPIRKVTYELDKRLKNKCTICPRISGLILLVITITIPRSLPKTPVNRWPRDVKNKKIWRKKKGFTAPCHDSTIVAWFYVQIVVWNLMSKSWHDLQNRLMILTASLFGTCCQNCLMICEIASWFW